MSADSTLDCPVGCGPSDTFGAYHEFYISDGKLHADYYGDCRPEWGGCGFEIKHTFPDYEIPNIPKPLPNTGFTGLI